MVEAQVEPTPNTQSSATSSDLSLGQVLFRASILTFGFVVLFIILTLVAAGWWVNRQIDAFTQAAGSSIAELGQIIDQGLNSTPQMTNDRKNILVLGVDSLETRGTTRALTDTMLIASLNLKTGTINTISLPRDLWSETYQTKINALYAYGQDRTAEKPAAFPQQALSELTGVPIHHTIVLTLDQVAELIDRLGGITINVDQSFTDTQFPRPDVDVTIEHNPAKLYKTVSFTAGPEKMTGQRALEYIRSRHSNDNEGDDLARAKRQQHVISALMSELTSAERWKQFILHPDQPGRLFKWYQTHFGQQLPLTELIATFKTLASQTEDSAKELTFSFNTHQLGVYPADPNGSLLHPPVSAKHQQQWVFVVRDQTQFLAEIRDKLQL